MDPSLSISGDPPFVSGAVSAPNYSIFGGPGPVNLSPYAFQTQLPPPQASPLPSGNNPSYSEMICAAIAALNEPEGSSKTAISKYIEKFNTNLPSSHGDLLSHHLKSLKNSGVLVMIKKSYKFASSNPESVAIATDAASQGLEAPRSEKRGRGRPPKPKPETQEQDVEKEETIVPKSTEEGEESSKRGPGRPRKNGAASIVQSSGIMKRRGRPPGRRAAGRQRKPKIVSSTASVFPYGVVNGARRRGRPSRVESSGIVAPVSGEVVAVAEKRGRGRPPKIGGVISRIMKPTRGQGRGRPRKAMLMSGATGTQDSAYRELKRNFDLFQEKVKEIVNVLKSGVTSDNQAVVQAIQELEKLTAMEPRVMEEVQAEDALPPPPQTEDETQGEEQTQDREGKTQTEVEALF